MKYISRRSAPMFARAGIDRIIAYDAQCSERAQRRQTRRGQIRGEDHDGRDQSTEHQHKVEVVPIVAEVVQAECADLQDRLDREDEREKPLQDFQRFRVVVWHSEEHEGQCQRVGKDAAKDEELEVLAVHHREDAQPRAVHESRAALGHLEFHLGGELRRDRHRELGALALLALAAKGAVDHSHEEVYGESRSDKHEGDEEDVRQLVVISNRLHVDSSAVRGGEHNVCPAFRTAHLEERQERVVQRVEVLLDDALPASIHAVAHHSRRRLIVEILPRPRGAGRHVCSKVRHIVGKHGVRTEQGLLRFVEGVPRPRMLQKTVVHRAIPPSKEGFDRLPLASVERALVKRHKDDAEDRIDYQQDYEEEAQWPKRPQHPKRSEASERRVLLRNHINQRSDDNRKVQDVPGISHVGFLQPEEAVHDHLEHHLQHEDRQDDEVEVAQALLQRRVGIDQRAI
eukprot:scaffold7328_cov314-Pinguiococcus_pyrenoidosus.AAC.84